MRRMYPLALVMFIFGGMFATDAMAQQVKPVKPKPVQLKPVQPTDVKLKPASELKAKSRGKLKITLKSKTQFVTQIRCEVIAQLTGELLRSSSSSTLSHDGANEQTSSELEISELWDSIQLVCHPGNTNQKHTFSYNVKDAQWVNNNEVVVGCSTTQGKCDISSNPR